MSSINLVDLANAKLDVDHIAEIATSLEPTATDRNGNVKATMAAASNAIAQTAAGAATFARIAAEAARDAALIQAGVYATEAAGRAAVVDGQAFKVQGTGDVAALEYRRINADTSVFINAYPSANAPITPGRTSFLIPGKNKFNKNSVVAGKYITPSGALFDNASYDTSDYIAVVPGTTYIANSEGIRFSCNYGPSKNVVAGGYGGDVSVSSLVIPDGVYFIRIAVGHDNDFLQLEQGNVSTTFESYALDLRSVDGTRINLEPAPQSVTPDITDFLHVGKNKFNIASVKPGFYLSPGGVEGANEIYGYSDFISVFPGPYMLNALVLRMSCFYNEKKEVIGGGYDGAPIDRFTIPDDVAFMRITVPRYGVEVIQLERGNVSTPFEEYRYELRAADGTPILVEGADGGLPGTSPMEAPVLAKTHYVPVGKELALYYENVVKDFQAHAGHIGISMSANEESSRETGEARKLLPLPNQVNTTVNGSATVVGSSFDFEAGAAGKWYQVRITDPANTTPVNIQNIGDSFSGRMTWTNVINATPAAAGITYSGNRTANSTTQTVKCEGQGGWTMESYFTVDNRGYLSPFMQPVNNFKHFGPTSFWIDANSASPSYNATYFFGIRDQFDAVTGRKKAPAVGDVMSEGGGYIVWTGAAWVAITLETLGGFAFSYAKYRAAWGIPRPDILHVLLGANDYYSADASSFPGTYAAYKARYDLLIASVNADSPACKIIVGIPVSSGRQGEYGTLNTERVKRAMWLLAKSLNADFGEREAEGIYVLDYHSIVHRVYGFDTTPEKPMADYAGPDTYKYTVDITHCSEAGFAQMGNAYMGLVQYLRSQI